ncbi:MAG TPA: hypothetical protein PKC24_00080 [Cyclobacteriaceae bacterium]|nr:hypothetical protein [Cyclobacteriaceae bacterium]
MASKDTKGKIVYSLSLLMMIFIILSFVAFSQLEKTEQIRKVDESIEKLLLLNLELFKNDVDFFDFDLNNKAFFETGSSKFLLKHDSILTAARTLINSVEDEESFGIDPALWHIDSVLIAYDSVFKLLVEKHKVRGYKGYGIEGELRDIAHEIEDKKAINQSDLQNLRRYEKNYLIRDDAAYAKKFQDYAMATSAKLKPGSEAEIVFNKYIRSFENLLSVSEEIGRYTQTGLKALLNQKTTELLRALDMLSKEAEAQTIAAHKFGMNIFLLCAIIAVASCFALIIFIARNIL